MGVGQENVYVIGASQILVSALGSATFPVKISAPAGCASMDLQFQAGTSVMIMPNVIAGGSIGGATAVLNGFLLPASVPYSVQGPASFYLASTGASGTLVGLAFKYSSGGTLI